MARIKKVPRIPHNVKERFRHQNLQRLLENVATHVPQLPALKKETKAKKLRRIVLYMKFLLQKRMQLSETVTKVQEHSCISSVEENKQVLKEQKENSKVYSEGKSKSRHPQIVFLRKSSQASHQNKDSATVTNEEAPCTKRCESEYHVTQKSSDACISLANEASVGNSLQENSSFNYCSPFNGNDLNCDIYPPCNFKTNIATFENPSLNAFKRPWEETIYDITEMCNIRPAKKNASSNQTKDTFDPNPSSFPECVFAESSMNDSFIAPNPGLNNDKRISETRDFIEKRAVFRNVKKEELPPFTTSNHPMFRNDAKNKLPPLATLNHPATLYPNLYFGNASLVRNSPKDVGFLQDGDNFPLEFFSSGDSAPITSSGEWFSSDETDFVEKMSQESTDFDNATVIVGNEDSFDSCNGVKKFSCDNYKDPTETFCDMEPYLNFSQSNAPMSFHSRSTMNPDVNMPDFSSDYIRCAANHNSAGYNELQNVINPRLVRHSDINVQQNSPGYYHVYPVSRIHDNGENSESIFEQDNSDSPQGSYYVYPSICDNRENSVGIVKEDNNGSPQESYYPEEEIVPNQNNPARLVETQRYIEFKLPKTKTRNERNVFVPNNDCLSADLNDNGDFFGNSRPCVANESIGCSSRNQPKQESSAQFGHSSFKVGDECDSYAETIVKQEDPEPSLLAEEISYSLNNLDTWYENCFNVQQAQ